MRKFDSKPTFIMRKTFFATLLLMMSISAFAGGMIPSSYDFSADNGEGVTLYYKNCEGGAMLVMPYYDSSSDPSWITWTEYVYTDPVINVPAMAGGLTVVAIDHNALYNSPSIQSITLPNTIKSIGGWAFAGDSSLTSINIPESVEYIGESAFNSTGLSSAHVSAKMAEWGMSLYQGCFNMQHVTFDEDVTVIPERIFFNCERLKSVTLPESVRKIDIGAFSACDSLAHINFPSKLDTIAFGAFTEAPLEEVTFPASLKNIQARAFRGIVAEEITSLIMEPAGVLEEEGIEGAYDWDTETSLPLPKLRVPKGTKALYQADPEWSKFTILEEGETEGFVHVRPAQKAYKTVREGQLFILRDGRTFNALGTELK